MPFEELNQNGNASHNAEKHNEEILTPEELREYVSLVIKSPDKTYSVESSQQFSQYLNKEASSRYKAIVLDAWNGDYDSLHFEVGLVQVNNTDHRNGVVHALHVSPFHVNFIAIEEPFFEYMHTHIYDAKAQVEVLEYQHKKQSQKTKNWGEGQSFLTDEQTSTASAAAAVDFESEAEEWIDLTDPAEYEQNIKRNEAELTTQEFIRLILTEFLRSGSSDMHIEAGQPTGRIRFRYDAEMFVRWDNIPFIKIKQICMGMAEISGKDATQMKFKDIDSTVKVRALRDGRKAEVELRFVSQPTLYAPSIVLRSQLKPIRDIAAVGLLPQQIADLKAAYSQKRGILIVTGATGSGKTNTLEAIYAGLEAPDTSKIIEIGEPIEIRSARRTQMSLRPNTQFTWWDAFYSCLRADPDIIGIGELRSGEHASVAINAALTGHLVLSTFHAANVEDTLTRLFSLGLPRENLSTGLNLILAQSLIKKLCEKCKVVDPKPSVQYDRPVYKSVGCPDCFNKGTRGRTAMAELLYFNDEVKEWVEDRTLTARDVVQNAIDKGYLIPMKVVAREKVLAGITSELEVAAVLGLVESKRQVTNRMYEDAAIAAAALSAQRSIDRHERIIEGETVR
ncbi:MAG: Flp pilus assembly complex ATPase component TadA [Acidobacteria bacterium]|nr:Flp pilus assembly complex ATPase component TadA [Acidobacteriota bacterium]MBK7932612.1 Flp pilus assembly complex ATPase component TadA [Acidobacteriota bacterium]